MIDENQLPSHSRFTYSERIVPFAAGLAVSGIYFYATNNFSGKDNRLLLIQTAALCSLSFARGFCTSSTRQNIYFFAIPISAGALNWRVGKSRNQALFFAVALLIQSTLMHLLGKQIRKRKQSKLHSKLDELANSTIEPRSCDAQGKSLIKSFAYAEDRNNFRDDVESLHIDCLLANNNFDEAESCAKTICNPEKRMNALMRIGEKDINRKKRLIDECLLLPLSSESLKVLQFEKQKCTFDDYKIIIPPKSEDHTGLSLEQWDKIKTIFSDMLRMEISDFSCTKSDGQRHITIRRPNDPTTYEWDDCPFTIKTLDVCGFLLITKAVVGSGAQETVKVVYNLTTGNYFAKKKASEVESTILEVISDFKKPGLPPTSVEANHKIYQPKFDCDLNQALTNGLLRTRIKKLTVIKQVLAALRNLHDIHIKGLSYTPVGKTKESSIPIKSLPLMHGDIKPQNIVFNKRTDEIMLIDFGMALELGNISGTYAYMDPQTLEYYNNPLKTIPNYDQYGMDMSAFSQFVEYPSLPDFKFPEYRRNEQGLLVKVEPEPEDPEDVKLFKYHLKFGQKRDVWAAGMVIAQLLFGEKDGMPDLHVFQKCLPRDDDIVKHYKWSDVLNLSDVLIYKIRYLKQESIDLCLDGHNKNEPLVPLLKRMLQVKASERMSSKEALEQFLELVPSFAG
ncbi:MAG: hypothetical protein H7A40_03995 [Chlamydiales bacterium]|nr:hypothetical protein [Chlamydiales bacterium]